MSHARLIVMTQYCENYGAHDWDGEGECPQYWKFKGGFEYLVAALTIEEASKGHAYLQKLVMDRAEEFTSNDDYTHEYILGWELFWGDELTPMEKLYSDYGDPVDRVVRVLS